MMAPRSNLTAGGTATAVASRSRRPRRAPDAPEAAALWVDIRARAAAIAAVSPFIGWPVAALQRLARAASLVRYAPGALLYRNESTVQHLAIVVAGNVESSVMAPDGRRVVFALDAAGRVYGLFSLIDGEPLTNDVVFVDSGVALEIPFAAVHAELEAAPALWAEVAREVNARGRRHTEQLKSFLFDALRLRAASLLLGMLPPHRRDGPVPAAIEMRLPQERFAEMLGVSRQAVSIVIRELVREGLVQWRYGRVTLLDFARLRALANAGIGQLAQWHAPQRSATVSAGRGKARVSSAC